MLDKIKKLKSSHYLEALNDVRTLGLIVFAVVALLVTWSGIKVVQTNYDLQKQISAMQQQNDIRRLENSNLALSNQFLETDQYLELTARKQFNMGLPGEKMLIVPRTVALAHTVDVPATVTVDAAGADIEETGPWYERNFNAWLEFVFRKES